MKSFPNGVAYYTLTTVEIGFPEEDVCCMRCPLMGTEYKPDREYCRLTGEYLPAPKDTVGFKCPLKFNKEETDGSMESG